MNRLLSIALLTVPAVCACRPERESTPTPASAEVDRVNVLLISADTLRADGLGCYGSAQRAVSPNVDALARDGVLFENYVSASPWTTPAHMSLITSLYPSSHGVIESFGDMMNKLKKNEGYNQLPDARLTLAELLLEAGFDTAAFTAGGTLDPRIGFDQGFDEYHTSMYKLRESNMRPMLDWLGARGDGPFLLFWHTFEVHAPYLRPDFLADVLPAEKAAAISEALREIDAGIPDGHPPLQDHYDNILSLPDLLKKHAAFRLEVTRALYDGGVKHMDDWLGRVIERLKNLDLYDRTLIIFTSDHGDEFAERSPEHFYDAHGHSTYREIIRVPLIIKLPNQQFAGTRVAQLVRTIDVMPTVLDILDIATDAPMEGATLRPLWDGEGDPAPRVAFTEGAARPFEVKSVCTDRYKYMVLIPETDVQQHGRKHLPAKVKSRGLYDLIADPGETRNLLTTPGAKVPADVLESLDQRLREFVETSSGVADRVELDEETLSRLRALGYVK